MTKEQTDLNTTDFYREFNNNDILSTRYPVMKEEDMDYTKVFEALIHGHLGPAEVETLGDIS